jgi:hypothetical protein
MKYLSILLLLLLHATAHGQGRNRKLLEVASHGKYKPGWYTLADGTRHAGKLRLWQTLTQNSVQVDQGKANPINLLPEQLRHFTMGTDSFTIAREVAVAGRATTQPFGEADIYRVVLTGKLQVLEYAQLVPSSTQYGPTVLRSWVLRPTSEAELVIIPSEEKAFAKQVAPFFIDNPALTQRIRAGLVGHDDFKRIVYAYVFNKEVEQVTYELAATLFE